MCRSENASVRLIENSVAPILDSQLYIREQGRIPRRRGRQPSGVTKRQFHQIFQKKCVKSRKFWSVRGRGTTPGVPPWSATVVGLGLLLATDGSCTKLPSSGWIRVLLLATDGSCTKLLVESGCSSLPQMVLVPNSWLNQGAPPCHRWFLYQTPQFWLNQGAPPCHRWFLYQTPGWIMELLLATDGSCTKLPSSGWIRVLLLATDGSCTKLLVESWSSSLPQMVLVPNSGLNHGAQFKLCEHITIN